jgi:hypothetical protein
MSSVALSAGATAVRSGAVLKVTDGGQVYKFTLAGAVSTAYSVTSGSSGGTLVEATGSAIALTQAMAAFASPGAVAAAVGGASAHPTGPMVEVAAAGGVPGSGWRAG